MISPTPHEQLMLELVNQARANPGAAAEKYNFSLGSIPNKPLEPLAMNEDLVESARAHSGWMERTDTFSHTGSGGSSPTQRAAAAGWDGGGVGENIAGWFGSGQSDVDQQKIAEEQHGGLLRSPGHMANIMNPQWSEAGIGIASGDWSRGGINYDKAFLYTQNFSDKGKSYLTGVAFDDNDNDNFYDVGEGLGGVKIEITDANGKKVETSTWDAGGYQIALEDGSYTARFSGKGIDGVVEKKFDIAGGNVKLDLNSDTAIPVAETPDTKEPEAKEPEAKEPEAKEPEAKEPEAKEPEAPVVAKGPKVDNGTEGDDVFMDVAGDQIVLAGAGNDRYETESRFDDFQFLILPNNGVLLLGEDTTKVLYDVEELEFADLSIQFKSDVDSGNEPVTPDAPDMSGQPDISTPVADADDTQAPRSQCPYFDDMMAA